MELSISDIFNTPASEDFIQKVEKHIGFRLPDDIRAAYLCFDGQKLGKRIKGKVEISGYTLFPLFYQWHTLAEALNNWDIDLAIEDSSDYVLHAMYDPSGKFLGAGRRLGKTNGHEIISSEECPVAYWPVLFDRRRLTLGVSGHFSIVADMNPREGGISGQLLNSVISGSCTWYAPGFGAHCERFVELIDTGEIFHGPLGWTDAATGERWSRPFEFKGFEEIVRSKYKYF